MQRSTFKFLILAAAGFAVAGVVPAAAHEPTPPEVDKTQGKMEVIYPSRAQMWGEEGDVFLLLQLDENGKPTGQVRITKSSGHDDLDTAAVQSVMTWRYVPARDDEGAPEASWIPLSVQYRLPKPVPKD